MNHNADTTSTGALDAVPPLIDEELASVLSRLAALQGYAVPVHRFGMMSVTAGGGRTEEMDRVLRATESWLTALPGGDVVELEELPLKEDLPVLWFSSDFAEVLLVQGLLSGGGFVCQRADGATVEKPQHAIAAGVLLAMSPELPVADHAAAEPKSAMDWFVFSIRKRRPLFVEAVFATAMASVLALVVSFYTMQVYDRVVPSQSYSTLIVLTIGAFLAIGLELLMKQVRAQITDRACKSIDQELSGVFFSRVLAIRMDARPRSIGTFASQVKQFELVRNFMTSSTLFLIADTPFVIFFVLVIFAVGGVVGWVPLLLLPGSVMAGLYAKWQLARLAEAQLRDANQKNGLLVEAIDGIEAIKAVGGEWKLLDRWQRLTADAAEVELRARAVAMTATNVTQSFQQLSYVLMIAAGVYAINTGSITMGALIACSIISNRALAPIAQIAGLIVQWQHAKVALKGLDDMMALPCDRNPGERRVIPAGCEGKLRLEAASFSYTEARPALQPTTTRFVAGERIAVLGSVGSGKSTLIKVLSGLYKPTEGRIFLDGVDMAHLAPEFMREHIGYLTQDVRLFNGTLRENLTLGLSSPTDGQILGVAAMTGLNRIIKNHPKGLELPIMEGGRGLSGGQRQIVGLSRLLLARPKILLLDEPTASMDGDLEAHVMNKLFATMAADSLIVIATHKSALLRHVSRVIVMDQGKILIDGPRDEVMAKLSELRRAPRRPQAAENNELPPSGEAA
jgi:ATP-binding cassette subfamily C protein LapB